jgi:hypothetical protein
MRCQVSLHPVDADEQESLGVFGVESGDRELEEVTGDSSRRGRRILGIAVAACLQRICDRGGQFLDGAVPELLPGLRVLQQLPDGIELVVSKLDRCAGH